MNYLQLWRSPGLGVSLLMATLAVPSAMAGGHNVRSGETLTAIARKYHVSLSTLQKANPGIKSGMITKGQVLNLPAAGKSGKTASADPVKKPVKKPVKTTVKTTAKTTPASGKITLAKSTGRAAKASKPESSADADHLQAAKPVKNRPAKSISTYRVKSGETLTGLARHSGISVGELAEMNGLESTELHEGQKLVLPARALPPTNRRDPVDLENTVDLTPPAGRARPSAVPAPRSAPPVSPPAPQGTYYHVVKRGDTFSSIARERGVTVEALAKANRSVNPNRLTLNQKLNVPGVQVASRQPGSDLIDEASPPTAYRLDASEAGGTGEPALPPEEAPTPPASRLVYRVTGRDSMDSIAKEFGTTPKELRHLNQMGPFDRLTSGGFLTVPWQETPQSD